MIGTNQNEGLLSKTFFGRNPNSYKKAFEIFYCYGPLAFFHREKDEICEEESEMCRNYVKQHFVGSNFAAEGKSSEALVQMYGDLLFNDNSSQ